VIKTIAAFLELPGLSSEIPPFAELQARCLEDWVDENNPVRVIDVFVDELNLGELGFRGVEPKVTGRHSYHPSGLLNLYIYGYLNRVQLSPAIPRLNCAPPGWVRTRRFVDFALSPPPPHTSASASGLGVGVIRTGSVVRLSSAGVGIGCNRVRRVRASC
jgi:hypothetical protein